MIFFHLINPKSVSDISDLFYLNILFYLAKLDISQPHRKSSKGLIQNGLKQVTSSKFAKSLTPTAGNTTVRLFFRQIASEMYNNVNVMFAMLVACIFAILSLLALTSLPPSYP